jgi:hypothetical protein
MPFETTDSLADSFFLRIDTLNMKIQALWDVQVSRVMKSCP